MASENQNQGKEIEKRGRKPGSQSLLKKQRTKFTPRLKRKFLKLLSEGYTKGAASALCGINRHTYLLAARNDPSFKEDIDIAVEQATAALEEELKGRIKNGTDTVEYDADGNIIKTTSKKSDTLLLRALEARSPSVWGKKSSSTNVNVNVDQTGNSAVSRLASLLGVSVDESKYKEPVDITDAEYEEKNSD